MGKLRSSTKVAELTPLGIRRIFCTICSSNLLATLMLASPGLNAPGLRRIMVVAE